MLTPDPGALLGFPDHHDHGRAPGPATSCRAMAVYCFAVNTESEAVLTGLEWMRYPAVLSGDSCLVAASLAMAEKRNCALSRLPLPNSRGTKVGLILPQKLSARYESDSLRQLLFSLVSGVDLDVIPVPRVQTGRVWRRSPCVEVFVRIVVVVGELDADVSIGNVAGDCPRDCPAVRFG
jgi:hypothetical protein